MTDVALAEVGENIDAGNYSSGSSDARTGGGRP
jgi:hypothetical protein